MSSFAFAARSRGNVDLRRDGLKRKNLDRCYDLRPGAMHVIEGGTPYAAGVECGRIIMKFTGPSIREPSLNSRTPDAGVQEICFEAQS